MTRQRAGSPPRAGLPTEPAAQMLGKHTADDDDAPRGPARSENKWLW